jgi:anti-sigma B factor antagonist
MRRSNADAVRMRFRNRTATSTTPEGDLRLEDDRDGTRHRLSLNGDLHLVTVDKLLEAVEGLSSSGATEVLLDLRGLTFMDSTGLAALLGCRALCREGCTFALTHGPAHIQRVFEITGLDAQFEFTERR